MIYDGFVLSRDVLYITGAVTGIAIGLLLSLFRKDLDFNSRNRRKTIALLFFSGTVAGAAVSFVFSMGGIFMNMPVLMICGICIVLCALAVCFPRAAAFPLIILSGLAVTWVGVSCLRFPVFNNAPAFDIICIENNGNYSYLIQFAHGAGSGNANEAVQGEEMADIIRISGKRSFLDCTVTVINIDPHFPFAGGRNHGFISSIQSDMGLEFFDKSLSSPLGRSFFPGQNSGFLRKALGIGIGDYKILVPLDNVYPGNYIPVRIDSYKGINQD